MGNAARKNSAASDPIGPAPATPGQSEAQRASDQPECEQWATDEAARNDPHDTTTKVVTGALLGGAILAETGAAALSIAGGNSAATGAALGATVGAIQGALSAGTGSAVADRQAVVSGWRNCMVARGYVVDSNGGGPLATNNVGNIGGAVGAVTNLQ